MCVDIDVYVEEDIYILRVCVYWVGGVNKYHNSST